MSRSRSFRLSLLVCALVAICVTGCAMVVTPAQSPLAGKSVTLPRAGVHGIAPQGTAAPLGAGAATILNRPLASTGCNKPSPVRAGTTSLDGLVSGGRRRVYRVHVPLGYTPRVPVPLVLNFHGHGSNAANQERMTGFSALADRYDFLVVYPQGVVGPDNRTGWNSGGPNKPGSNDVLFVSDLLTKMQSEFCVDPTRIYATGFSNGGAMTSVLACALAGRIAAFASVSGSYYPLVGGCHPGRPVSVLEFHGTGDYTVPYVGRAVTDLMPVPNWLQGWVGRDACASEPAIEAMAGHATLYTWTGCAGDAVVQHYRISGWGHRWPALPATTAQERNDGGAPVASVLIWNFFAAHPLPSAAEAAESAAS
ncbi:MAG: extracellular catalytic domain type 1 short-chain-length polyhydroxyalkanoate depolymerase [Ktedonobacterales bacterium]